MNYLWKFRHFFGSLNSRSFSTGFQLLTMLGGMSKFQTTNLQSSKRSLFWYLFTSVWACILFCWIDPCLLHSVRWHCLKIKSWETTWQSEKKIKFIRWALLTFLCKIWSNPQKTRTKSLPFNISQEVSTVSEYNKNFFQHLMATWHWFSYLLMGGFQKYDTIYTLICSTALNWWFVIKISNVLGFEVIMEARALPFLQICILTKFLCRKRPNWLWGLP